MKTLGMYAYLAVVTLLGILQVEWSQNLYFFFSIITTILFTAVGMIAQKEMREKTAKATAQHNPTIIVIAVICASNTLLSIGNGGWAGWIEGIFWFVTAVITASTAIRKNEYLKYLKEKDANENRVGDVPGMHKEES